MKMSRVSDKNKELVEEKDALSESDIEEEEEDEQDKLVWPQEEVDLPIVSWESCKSFFRIHFLWAGFH